MTEPSTIRTAFHEASHAFVADLQGMTLEAVTIESAPSYGGLCTYRRPRDQGTASVLSAACQCCTGQYERAIMIALAGAAGEELAFARGALEGRVTRGLRYDPSPADTIPLADSAAEHLASAAAQPAFADSFEASDEGHAIAAASALHPHDLASALALIHYLRAVVRRQVCDGAEQITALAARLIERRTVDGFAASLILRQPVEVRRGAQASQEES